MADKSDKSLWQDWTARLSTSKNARTLWEAQVATTSHFAAGLQRYWWDDMGHFRQKRLQPHEIWRTINLFPVSLNTHESRLTMNDPHWSPKKSPGMEEVSDLEVQAANAVLQAVWDGTYMHDLPLKRIVKQAIRKAYIEGGAIFYNRFDDDLDMPVVDLFALWDTYSDPNAEDIYNKQWMSFAVPKGLDWIMEQKKKGWDVPDDYGPDAVLAESSMKSQFIMHKSGFGNNASPHSRLLILAFEYGSNGLQYSVIDKQGHVLHKQELTQFTSLCDLFTVYHPIDTGDFYARPPTIDWVDPQKTINKLYSSIECYIDVFGQGKWILEDENTTIPVAGVHGQKIFARQGSVQALPMQPLPQTHFQHLAQAISQFEQISGVHSESLGRQSGSVDSGKGIAQLQALDEQNSSSPVDNFKMTMQEIGCKVLRDAAANWSNIKTLYRYDKIAGQSVPMEVMGETAYKLRKNSRGENTVAIRPFEQLGVEIIVGRAFSQTQKLDNLTQVLSVWQPGNNRATDRIILPLVSDAMNIGVGEDIARQLKKLEDPNLMIMEGKAMLIADGQKVIVNASDDHVAYAAFYTQKAQEYQRGGDMKAANLLNAQASLHNTMAQHEQQTAQGPQSPEAPQTIPQAKQQTETTGGALPIAGAPPPVPLQMFPKMKK